MTVEQVLEFWFSTLTNDEAIIASQSVLWWKKQDSTDELIKSQFEESVRLAAAGEFDEWKHTPSGRLALIILLDQFPRNIYRDTPLAFAFDSTASSLCLEGLAKGDDQALSPIRRVFFYLPLEHAEDKKLQDQSVALFRSLLSDLGPEEKKRYAGYLDFAIKHQAIIERFGRFPHRNRILQRDSTSAELEFLKQPGSSF